MKPSDFDWGTGTVTYWGMDGFDPRIQPTNQRDELKEDLIQVQYGENKVVDVGWYPAFSPEGCFVVFVVHDEDWDEPLQRFEAKTIGELRIAIRRGIEAASD